MSIPAAYIGVILIWATTPLTVKWGGEGSSFAFAAALRMSIGIVCVLILMALMRVRLVWHRDAIKTYLSGVIGVFGAMSCVYWSAQYIPSGWVSVLFGLTPIVTALLAAILLGERIMNLQRVVALVLGVAGLYVMYGNATGISHQAMLGVFGVLAATLLHGLSAVCIKHVDAGITGLTATAGSLILSLPLFLLSWWLLDGHIPEHLPERSLWAIIYTGVIATAVGFSMYFYVLKNVSATRTALVTLISPVLALWLGQAVNDEPVTRSILIGTGLILTALMLFELTALGQRLRRQV